MTDAETDTAAAESSARRGLFRHQSRPEWGFAVLAWDEGDRRGYQFDDGKLRVFKAGYYDFLEPVDDAGPGAAALESDLRASITGRDGNTPRKPLVPEYPFAKQLEIFRELFPKGFQGERWIDKHRGAESAKRLKRHRGLAAIDAKKRLSAEILDAHLAADEHAAMVGIMLDVLAHTSLVSSAGVTALAKMDGESLSMVATTLRDVLHGDGKFDSRFTTWVAALTNAANGKRPTWRLATALPALVQPELHTDVRRTVYLTEATLFSPEGTFTATPRRGSYGNFLEITRQAHTLLLEAGLKPRDLLDVHDFIWLTLRPNAIERAGKEAPGS